MPIEPSEHHLIVWFKRVVRTAQSIWAVHVVGPIVSANWLLKRYDRLIVRYYRIAVVPIFSWRNYRVPFGPSELSFQSGPFKTSSGFIRTTQDLLWSAHVASSGPSRTSSGVPTWLHQDRSGPPQDLPRGPPTRTSSRPSARTSSGPSARTSSRPPTRISHEDFPPEHT